MLAILVHINKKHIFNFLSYLTEEDKILACLVQRGSNTFCLASSEKALISFQHEGSSDTIKLKQKARNIITLIRKITVINWILTRSFL